MATGTATRTKIQVILAEPFQDLPWLKHGFSTRRGGVSKCYGGKSLNLGLTGEDTREAVETNRELFFAAIGAVGTPNRAKPVGHLSTRAKALAGDDKLIWPSVAMKQIHS